jgi:hypothetical protein
MEILKLILRLRQSIGLQASISRIFERHLLILFCSRFSWSYVPRHLFLLSSSFGNFTDTQGSKTSWSSTCSQECCKFLPGRKGCQRGWSRYVAILLPLAFVRGRVALIWHRKDLMATAKPHHIDGESTDTSPLSAMYLLVTRVRICRIPQP